MFAPIICLSLFIVSALVSVELHAMLELPRAVRSLTESRRFKQHSGFHRATRCIILCARNFNRVLESLDMEQLVFGLLDSRLYDPETFDSFCEGIYQWNSCSQGCSNSRTKDFLESDYQPFDSLCGEDRETFESNQACYRESDPKQNQVCDPKCGGQEVIKELNEKFKILMTAFGDEDVALSVLNKACKMLSCNISRMGA